MALRITDTTLRDAQQSLLATRMKIEDLLPMAEVLDGIGFQAAEVWGGATFDSCLRFLNEDPWERLRLFRRHFRKTPLQMLLRGQNLVGYRHYPDDLVEAFVKRAVADGIGIFRVFDALNDVRNMAKAMAVARAEGAHVQGTVVYTESPVHDLDHFVATARELRDLGADSICIKDMAGLLTPFRAAEMVRRLKAEVDLPVQLHAHYTSGLASMTYLKAIEAGVDGVDTAVSSMALGTSQPATESILAALRGTTYDPGLDLEGLATVAEYFREVRAKYRAYDVGSGIDVDVIRYQVPGGMISNFVSQLSQQGALHRLPEVLAELPRVRADLGYPPLVTPTSQIVGSQAVLNVLMGERYKLVTNEVKSYLKGLYGRPPGPVNEEVRRKIVGEAEITTERPADSLRPVLKKAAQEIAYYVERPEDVITYALFPEVARKFLQERLSRETRTDLQLAEAGINPV